MKNEIYIHLPGGSHQVSFTLGNTGITDKNILIIGSGSEQAALAFQKEGAKMVELIVDDYESLVNSNLALEGKSDISAKMMEFDCTDYPDDSFDIIYAQASISGDNRNKVLKEIKRMLADGGSLIAGEIVKLEKDIPPFVKDIFDSSALNPLHINEITPYYEQRGWQILKSHDYSYTLKEYYSGNLNKLEKSTQDLSDREKSYYKKLINQISHHSKAYLKQGGDKYIGFITLLMKLK